MRVWLAYIGVILLWATTPLAIKWSAVDTGFIFGVASRMAIGLICISVFLLLRRQRIPAHKSAVLTYAAIAGQIYGAMLSVYWAAQFIPSGWISVIFGLSPLLTAILAAIFLQERSLTVSKILSYVCGIAGLAIMFGSAMQINKQAVYGIIAVLFSAFMQTGSAIVVKRINAGLPSTVQVAGGLAFAVPLYLLTWWYFDRQFPLQLSPRAGYSIAYLGIVATTVGFAMYYYVLKHMPATRVALITLVTPVLSLMVGNVANAEAITPKIMSGTGLIICALLLHGFFDRKKRQPRATAKK